MAHAHRPADLLRRLRAEHSDNYVYRGEFRPFDAPLWPSKYRRFFSSEGGIQVSDSFKIRGEQGAVYFRLDFMRDPTAGRDAQAYEAMFKREQMRHVCMSHVRNALGYALSEAMFQQAGWSSEALDVTYDPVVAFVFALRTWREDGSSGISPRREPAVIYRWKVPTRQWTFSDLRAHNYYSCPSFVPTREICRLFRTGSMLDFQNSLAEYRQAIRWQFNEFDLDLLQNARPFEIICLPEGWAADSRVERQCAAVMLPDVCRQEAAPVLAQRTDLGMMSPDAIDPNGNRLSVRDCLNYGSFVEDLASRPDVERFLLDASTTEAIEEIEPELNREVLPRRDHTFDLLEDWIKPFYRPITAYGTLPIPVGPGLDVPVEVLWETLGEHAPERGFSR